MDTATLHQLGDQLTYKVHKQTKPDLQVELSVTELPAMSISNPFPSILPGPQLLHELALGKDASHHDSNHAIEFLAADGNICCLSYRSLDRLSSKLATQILHTASARGAETKKLVVPVLLPQSLELYIAWLAILKAGGAFCPLNTDAPPERIEFILQDVSASVMITQSALAARLPAKASVTVINTDDLELAKKKDEDEDAGLAYDAVEIPSTNLAYVMYTSGSTGRPKGVGISHLAATQSLLAHNDLIPPFDRFLQFASPTFDVSVFEVFFPFMRKATLIGSEREQMLLDIAHVMTEMRVDAAELTPTVAGELLRTRAAAPSLRVLLTIGEMLTKHVVDEFGQSETSDGILHGMYGPTEAAIHCTAATQFQSNSRVNLIGKPFKTVSAFIMSLETEDKSVPLTLEPLTMGEIGELVVGGPQLADGYINRPEENAKAFIDSPVYGRLYRTGDKARMLPSGDIECFGRISSGQVKLRGQRMELGEIEHVLLRVPEVRSAVAIVSGGSSLAAFVLVNDKGTTDRELRDMCRQWLPRFMVPGEFVVVDQFPQLPSGKIDRKALEAEFASRRTTANSNIKQHFRDETEEIISSCVMDALGRQPSPSESLIANGLDSLAAIRLTSYLLDAGMRLDVAQVLNSDSVEGIWHLVKEMGETQSTEDTHTGLRRIRQLVTDAGEARIDSLGLGSQVINIEPSTHIQQAMILETMRNSQAYCNWVELEFQRSLDLISIQKAFRKLLEMNPLLKSGFVEVGLKDHVYAQFTWKAFDDQLFIESDVFDYEISMMTKNDLLHPLRLQFRETQEGIRVLVHIHHALYDGWSWQLILKDLHRLLLGEELPPKPAYSIVSDFLIEHKLSEAAKESSLFWRDQLQGLSPVTFPNFHNRRDVTPGTQEAVRVLNTCPSKLRDVSQHLMVSRQAVFQAAFCYILSCYLGSGDVVFGTVFSGRTLPVKGIEAAIGPCIRTLPTRMNLDKMQNVSDLLLAIQNMNRKSLEYGSLPLQEIKKVSGIQIHQTLFDTAIVWQESIWANDTENALFQEVATGEFLELALLLEFEPRENEIYAKATYQNSVFPHEQVQILLEQIDLVASILIESPTLQINQICGQISSSVLSISNPSPECHKKRSSLVTGMETIAFIDPTRQAVEIFSQTDQNLPCSELQGITYGELNSRANQLAHYLVQQGLARDQLAAVRLDKSIDSCISILAIAKIGAGLLPLIDRTSPQMIESIRASTNIQPWIIRPSTGHIAALDPLHSVSQIFIPASLDAYPKENPLTTHDTFYIVCIDGMPAEGKSVAHTFISHHDLQSHINVLAEPYPTASGSKILQATPSSLNASIIESFFAWHMGMTLCFASNDDLTKRPSYVIEKLNITHLHLTPTLASRINPKDVPSVRFLLTSGESLTAKVHRDWAEAGLRHGYDNSGLTGICTVQPGSKSALSLMNVGKPLQNTSAMVVREQGPFALLPLGAVGELCFGGDQVARVLPGSQDQASASFIEHSQFGRVRRTGDLGRILSDGSIVLVPRCSPESIHVDLATVEEIEHAILSSGLVESVASLVLYSPVTQRQQLITVWVPPSSNSEPFNAGDHSVAAREISSNLTRTLPLSSLPSLLVPLREIPMTDYYKIDAAKIQDDIQNMGTDQLREFALEAVNNANDELNDLEKTIAAALATTVGLDKKNIDKNTSFYRMGLDSLSAISFSRKLQEMGCGRFDVSTILRHSSIAQLATLAPAIVDDHQPHHPVTKCDFASIFDESFVLGIKQEFEIENTLVQSVYPCTPLQEAMLAAESDKIPAYFNHLLLSIKSDIDTLKRAWTHMVSRHEILRTCFKPTNHKQFAFAQVVLADITLPWAYVESPSDKLHEHVEKSKSEFERQSPVGGRLPYFLTILNDTVSGKAHLLLSIHHALYDGEGISQLLHEIELVLAGKMLSDTTAFHKFIEHMISTSSDSSDKFWDRSLAGVSPTLLSAPEFSQEGEYPSASRQIHLEITDSLESFKEKCRKLSVTPLNIFQAAWAKLLSFYSDTSDVCFGNVFSCRTIPLKGVQGVVGPCFNTLPIRVKLAPTATNEDILKLSQKINSDILPHQLTPLRRIQRRALHGQSRLFDTLLILQSADHDLDSRYWELVQDEGNMGFPLICEIIPDEKHDCVRICLHYNPSSLSQAVAEQLAQTFLGFVEQTVLYPSAQAAVKRSLGQDFPEIFEKRQSHKSGPVHISLSDPETTRPWSYQEEALRDILCKFSGVDEQSVSIQTTIFQLGLDSIHAVQIAGKLRRLGFGISAGDILEAASIEKIASLLETNGKEVSKQDAFDFASFEKQHLPVVCQQLGISPQTVQACRPCTPVQNGMLALFIHSQGKTYFNRMSVNFPMPLNKKLLKEAWSKVADQHEMLRTGFVQRDDQQYPFAMITYQKGLEIPWFEATDCLADIDGTQEQSIVQNLHRPPWQIVTTPSESVTKLQFSALHALYDAQSLESIFADVLKVYEGKLLTEPASIEGTLGPLLVECQKQSLSAKDFWQGLATEIRPSKFPDLHPIRAENHTLIDSSICSSTPLVALEAKCRDIGVTLQAAGQVAWARLLAAYTGERNVTFGTVFSGRNLSEAAQYAVFPCLVTVPSPHFIEGSNIELLNRTLKTNASLVKNQFTPLAQIQRWLGSDEPLFDTLFVYQKFSSKPNDSNKVQIVDEETRIDYPLSIELVPVASSLEIRVSYRSDVVPREQALILLNQYDKLLENTLFSSDSDSDDYLFLDHQLLSITPAMERTLPTSVSLLHQFVEQNAAQMPDKTAFEFAFGTDVDNLKKKTWSYRQFNEDGNRVAHFLQSKGATPGGLVAICFDKCPEASIAILGILKSGCAYLAIDPSAPISRKQFIMKDSNSTILLCNQARKPELDDLSGVDVQALDESSIFNELSCEPPLLSRQIQPNDTCYCLYTSGTTGTPKGCEITHDNAVQAMLAFQRLFSPHWDEDSRWLQFASFHFDVSVLEQYWSWSVGICVTSCPRDLLFEDLPGTIQKLQITHIDLTPSLARLVHPDEVPSLCRGVFITGGEALKQEILDAWGEHGVIYNGYGPTEVTIGCTMLPRMRANDKPSNIGPQFDNVGSYVFRPGTSDPVLRGGIGELCVSGPLVGKGYLNRAELTKERFQDLPQYEDRIYRTGDLVRILHDGSFQFLGRIDDQVKLRGQRLEIGEINEVIKQATPGVNEVATLVVKHPKQSKDQLVSFVSMTGSDKKSRLVEIRSSDDNCTLLSDLKAACHTHLPGYMVPTHIIPLTCFPLSANNKADMKVLKSLYQDLSLDDIQQLSAMTASQPIAGVEEEKIIAVLTKFLGLVDSKISSWSSIYELGLDSISVIAFARALREAGYIQAQPSLIMKCPTIAGMASALQASTKPPVSMENMHMNARQAIRAFAHKHSHFIIENIGVTGSDVEQIAPCTPLQEGMIYHFLSSITPMYCSSFTFDLETGIDLERLKRSWEVAQCQVQMLRARFSPSSDGYAQAILKKDALPWSFIAVDSESHIEKQRKQQLELWISSLDGLTTRLWEVAVIASPQKAIMCLNIFHALYDGNSLGVLLDLVTDIYHDQSRAADKTPEFLDVLHLGPLCKDPGAESFWKDHLANCQVRPSSSPEQVQTTSFIEKMDINTTAHLDSLRKKLNTTDQAILHACWLLTLHQHHGYVPPLGIIVSGRTIDLPGIENVIGPLFNTVPSNVQFYGLKSWAEVAQRCHEYHASMMQVQYTPLRDIVKWLGRNPDEPLFDSLFVFQREKVTDNDSSTNRLWSSMDSEAEHDYPLALEVVRHGNKSMSLTLAAKSHEVNFETAKNLLVAFEKNMEEFAQTPDRELPYLNGIMDTSHNTTNEDTTAAETAHSLESESSFRWSTEACTIRDCIANLAGVDATSVREETSIFEVGLDSIDAIKLSSRLSKLGIKIPVSIIMRNRHVKAMVGQLAITKTAETNGTYPLLGQMEQALTESLGKEGVLPKSACRVLPATPIQEAMVAEMTASGYRHYYNHELLKLEPHVDLAKLQEAWMTLVNAHPILRTSFVEVLDPQISSSYAQIVHNEGILDFRIVSLEGTTIESIIESQRNKASTELANLPLLSLTIIADKTDHYLILSIAHALYDGWSISLLHEDVAKTYAGEDITRPSSDAILEQILASSGEQALKFWRATLANCTPIPFPPGKHSGVDSSLVHRAERQLSVPFNQADAFCKRHGITMQALLVTCWSLVLATYVKQLDVVFGLVFSGRNVAGSESVMFPTMNTVAMRVILHGTRLDLVKFVQDTLLDMSEHQHFPLRRARPDANSGKLFDTLFIYQKRPSEDQEKASSLYSTTGVGASDVEYPVCAEVEGVGESFVARVACRGSVLGEEDTLELLEHISTVLGSIFDHPDQQTVDFTGEGLNISGYAVSPESPVQEVESGGLSIDSSKKNWSPVESKIRNVLSVVSGVPRETIDHRSNIFQLGLDSISAIKVASLLKKQSVRLTVTDMLKAGTIEKMAELVDTTAYTDFTPTEIENALKESLGDIQTSIILQSYGIDFHDVQKVFPATAGQTYFLAMHSLNPEVFYPEFSYLSSQQLDHAVLEASWSQLIDQTPILRTAFVPTDHQQTPYLEVVFHSAHNPIIWHETVGSQISAAKDVRGFGQIQATLHAHQTNEGMALTLKIHHALYDAISLPCMMKELAQLCEKRQAKSKPSPYDISQLVAIQHIHSPVESRRHFWQKYLDQAPGQGHTSSRLGEFGAIEQHYRPGLVPNMSRVETAAKLQGLGVQSLFLAAYARVHAETFSNSASESLVVGLYLANRSYVAEELSDLIAPTVNIVPLRLDNKISTKDDSLFSVAQKIQEDINLISGISQAGVSLVEIAEWTGVRVNTCINFLRLPEVEEPVNGATSQLMFQLVDSTKVEGSENPNGSNLCKPIQSLANGDTANSPTSTQVIRATASTAMENVFWPTIDVEAAIREDQLDFGLFAPNARLDRDTATHMITRMQQEMNALTEIP